MRRGCTTVRAVFDRAGNVLPREQWPPVALRYAAELAEIETELDALLMQARQQQQGRPCFSS